MRTTKCLTNKLVDREIDEEPKLSLNVISIQNSARFNINRHRMRGENATNTIRKGMTKSEERLPVKTVMVIAVITSKKSGMVDAGRMQFCSMPVLYTLNNSYDLRDTSSLNFCWAVYTQEESTCRINIHSHRLRCYITTCSYRVSRCRTYRNLSICRQELPLFYDFTFP